MKKLSAFCCVVALSCTCVGGARDSKPAPTGGGMQTTEQVQADPQGAEILSDTQGVNFQPYLKDALKRIYWQWVKLIQDEARPPRNKKGITSIRFTIKPDGTIAAVHLDESANDDALNGAAWGAITGVGKLPALPSTFHGPGLELRLHFRVNE